MTGINIALNTSGWTQVDGHKRVNTRELRQENKHKQKGNAKKHLVFFTINAYTSRQIITKQLGVDKFCEFDREL